VSSFWIARDLGVIRTASGKSIVGTDPLLSHGLVLARLHLTAIVDQLHNVVHIVLGEFEYVLITAAKRMVRVTPKGVQAATEFLRSHVARESQCLVGDERSGGGIVSSLVEMAAEFLRPDEREAVLGDLAETGADALSGLRSVLGFVLRQRLELWRCWRPWIAGGVTLAGSLLLRGVSFGLSVDTRDLLRGGPMYGGVIYEALLMLAWAWTSGFMAGSLSRRTVWMSGILCAVPCLSCVLRFQDTSLSRLCVLWFLVPGLVGVVQGMRCVRLHRSSARVLAMAVTGLMFAWRGMGFWNWFLLMPAWFLFVSAKRSKV
jgi:hypothetical protein